MFPFPRLAIILLLLIAALGSIGWYLSPQDNLAPSDAIVAISGDDGLRFKTAVSLKKSGWAPLLIFSGAAHDPESPSNAKTMKRQAIKDGVRPEHILIEEESKNTRQNALFTSEIIKARGMKRIILVTSPYHQRRASLEFSRALGDEVRIINYSAKDDSWVRSRWWTTPRGWYLTVSEAPKLLYSWISGPQSSIMQP